MRTIATKIVTMFPKKNCPTLKKLHYQFTKGKNKKRLLRIVIDNKL